MSVGTIKCKDEVTCGVYGKEEENGAFAGYREVIYYQSERD